MPSPELFSSIFSTGDFSEFDDTDASPTIVTSPVHCGSYAAKFNADGERIEVNLADETEVCVRYYLRYDTEPTAGQYEILRSVHLLGDAGATSIGRCYMESRSGGKCFRMHCREPTVQDIVYWFDWQINTWYCIDFYFKKHASTGRYKLYVNDNLVCDSGDIDTSGAPDVDRAYFGIDYINEATPFTNVCIDCIAIFDTGPIGTHENLNTGFEELDFSVFDSVVGGPTIAVDKFHCGVASMKASIAPTESEGVYVNLGHHKEAYLQFEVKFADATPPTGEKIYFAYIRESTDSNNILALFIYNDGGTVKWGYTYRAAGSTTTVSEGTAALDPDDDTWYCVRLKIVMSSQDGDALGSYAMWIDGTLLDDIDVSGLDTDYVGVTVLRLVTYTAAVGGAIVYTDCVEWSDEAITCHEAGSVEPVSPNLVTETDCEPPIGNDFLQVYRNCQRVYVEKLSVSSTERGIASLTVPHYYPVARGDLFHVIVDGSRILQGKVVSIHRDRKAGTKVLTCQTKSARLYGRQVLSVSHSVYAAEDIGAIVKDLIDYYFEGLFTTNNVNINTGVTVSDFSGYDKSVGDAVDDLITRGDAFLYIDKDNDVHFDIKGAENSNAVFNYDNICGNIVVEEVGEVINTIIVKGITGVSAQAGSGIPEVKISERRITTNAEAQELADALLENYGVTQVTSFQVTGFFNLRHGQSAILDAPRDGYDYESIVIGSVVWELTPNSSQTKVTVGDVPLSFERLLMKILRNIEEQQVNLISDHEGADTGSADPELEEDTILDESLSSEVRLQTSELTLRSAVADAGTDSCSLSEIIAYFQRGATGGSGRFKFWVEDGSSNIYYTGCYELDANNTTGTFSHHAKADLSGLTLYLKARGYAGCDVYVRASFQVNQQRRHKHDVSQPRRHGFS